MLSSSPQQLVRFLQARGIRRFHLVYDPARRRVVPSHECLQPLADFISDDRRDFLEHEGAFFQVAATGATLQGAFVHRTRRGAAAGGVRYWHYSTVEAYLRDGLRLAAGMTRKNALAGLWWGGGKGVMVRDPSAAPEDPAARAALYREYGALMTALRGCYVTAEDVGTSVSDMANVFAATRFSTCIPPELGGSGNPSGPTARGVVCGIEAALDVLEQGGVAGKTIAVQGMGHVGEPLIELLLEAGAARVLACDIDARRVAELAQRFAGRPLQARTVTEGDTAFSSVPCDVLSPCATGGTLNARTIPTLRARIVCGAANNQLEDPSDGRRLHERGIVYVPDFLTNRMGIVTCADEQAGYVPNDERIERHLGRTWEHSIFAMARTVLRRARELDEPSSDIATAMADELSEELHPLYGHRGRQIIDGLLADRWFER